MMVKDLTTFLHDALDCLEQTSSVEVFFIQFETIRDLLYALQPWIPETYFTDRFIYGLRQDVQRYVLKFHPSTILDAFHLSSIYEYTISEQQYECSNVVHAHEFLADEVNHCQVDEKTFVVELGDSSTMIEITMCEEVPGVIQGSQENVVVDEQSNVSLLDSKCVFNPIKVSESDVLDMVVDVDYGLPEEVDNTSHAKDGATELMTDIYGRENDRKVLSNFRKKSFGNFNEEYTRMNLILDSRSRHKQKSFSSMPLSPVVDKGIGKTIYESDDITSFAVMTPVDDGSVLEKINDGVVVTKVGFLLVHVQSEFGLHSVRAISSLNSQVILNKVYSEFALVHGSVIEVKQSGKGGTFNLITYNFLNSYFLGSSGKPPPEYDKWYGVQASALCTVQQSSELFICCYSAISVTVSTKRGSRFLSRFRSARNCTPPILKVPCNVSFDHGIKFCFPYRLSASWWCIVVGCEAKKGVASKIPITAHTEQYKFFLQFHGKCIYDTQEVSPKVLKPIVDFFSYTILKRLCVIDPFLNCALSLSVDYVCQFVALLNPLRAKEAKTVAYLTLNVMCAVLNVLACLNHLLYMVSKEDAMAARPNVIKVITKRSIDPIDDLGKKVSKVLNSLVDNKPSNGDNCALVKAVKMDLLALIITIQLRL